LIPTIDMSDFGYVRELWFHFHEEDSHTISRHPNEDFPRKQL